MCIIVIAAMCFFATGSVQPLQDSQKSSCIVAFTAASLAAPTPEVKLLQFCLDVSICLEYLTSPQFPSPGGQFMPCPVRSVGGPLDLQACSMEDRAEGGPSDGYTLSSRLT